MKTLLQQLIKEHLLFLSEGRKDDAAKRFPDVDVEELSQQDPSGTKFIYLMWMAREVDKGHSIEDVVSVANSFNKHKEKIRKQLGDKPNIEQWDTEELNSKIESMGEFGPSRSKQRQETKSGAPKIAETENLILLRIDTKAASVQYGRDTKWCISMDDEDHYENYTGHANVIFYFIFRKKPLGRDRYDKVAISIQRDTENKIKKVDFFDALDRSLKSIKSLEEKLPGIAELISVAKKDSTNRPKCVEFKLRTGEKLTDQEVISYWNGITGDFALDVFRKKLSIIKGMPLKQRKILLPFVKEEEFIDLLNGVASISYDRIVYKNKTGKFHSIDDKPAMILGVGTKEWYQNGKLHRDDDKPAIIHGFGTKEWWVNGKQHRDGGLPAKIDEYGSKQWWVNGKLHRDDGPAVIDEDGRQEWWRNGKKHREGGLPAVIDGKRKEYWINGKKVKLPKEKSSKKK